MHMQGRKTELRYAVFPTYEPGQLADSSDHESATALWKPAIEDFSSVCNILDYLREKYYGIVPPDSNVEPEPQPKKGKRHAEETDEDEDRGD